MRARAFVQGGLSLRTIASIPIDIGPPLLAAEFNQVADFDVATDDRLTSIVLAQQLSTLGIEPAGEVANGQIPPIIPARVAVDLTAVARSRQ